MTSRRSGAERLWLELMSGDPQPSAAKPSEVRLRQTPQEASAHETTRAARALTDEATGLRQASTARLRQARLDKRAEDAIRLALAPPKTARRRAG
jgi:hypothetical protein